MRAERTPAAPGSVAVSWKQRLLLALLPGSFGPGYRRSLLQSLDEAFRDVDAVATDQDGARTHTWRRARLWADFFMTAMQERGTAITRRLGLRTNPHLPRSPRRKLEQSLVRSWRRQL